MTEVVIGALLLFCAVWFGYFSYAEIKKGETRSVVEVIAFILMGIACLAVGIGTMTGWF